MKGFITTPRLLRKARASYLELAGLQPAGIYLLRSVVTIALATCPLMVCAWLAESSGRWELFERSGSITTAIGLMLASRRHIRYGVLELAVSRAHNDLESDVREALEDILTAKLGLVTLGIWNARLGMGHISPVVELQLPGCVGGVCGWPRSSRFHRNARHSSGTALIQSDRPPRGRPASLRRCTRELPRHRGQKRAATGRRRARSRGRRRPR